MQRSRVVLGADLDPWDEFDTYPCCLPRGFLQTRKGIVIGKGYNIDAHGLGMTHQLSRGKFPVGGG